ncbi:hypothetical protein [Geomesophilobacter sediminis]|uniref:Uncharacterized protein n=1 Tax=Geomesophilobacter sediminis TaxID=2798584 RepID=A0A8J7M1X3_9BACT|nr:hypothetical protein [Geomesophilobacter sediminis]MBJ6726873.1 hypothetical protein [Geomesophilobacter sediminis]
MFFRIPKDAMVWSLLLVSLALYGVDFFFYRRLDEIGSSFMGNLAFLPVYVLFVTLMIERVLKEREREAMRKKLNMVIGVFFSEIGNRLLRDFLTFFEDGVELSRHLHPTVYWKDNDFAAAQDYLKGLDLRLNARKGDLPALKELLLDKKEIMLMLMENPNLLEHASFTDLLWAVFHVIEELQARQSLDGLPNSDLDHLSGDLKRAHTYLLIEWVSYMAHLKSDYPYLYSLAIRMNPMDPKAHPEVL